MYYICIQYIKGRDCDHYGQMDLNLYFCGVSFACLQKSLKFYFLSNKSYKWVQHFLLLLHIFCIC